MTEALLNKVYGEVVHEQAVPTSDEDVLGKALVKQFKIHLAKFKELTEEARKVLKEDLEEQHRHITSEDLHVGWDSKVSVCIHAS
jgi:cell division cycle protein 37